MYKIERRVDYKTMWKTEKQFNCQQFTMLGNKEEFSTGTVGHEHLRRIPVRTFLWQGANNTVATVRDLLQGSRHCCLDAGGDPSETAVAATNHWAVANCCCWYVAAERSGIGT